MEKHKIGDLEITRDQDSVKLIKNTKGYFWEIRVVERDGRDMLAELETIDAKLKQNYGSENE